MFAMKKILTAFLLPPGVFVPVLIALGLYLLFIRKRRAGLIGILAGMALWAACTSPVSNFLMEGLESRYPIPETLEGDVIILLGGGVIDGVPDVSGTGVPTGEMFPRIVTAARLQKRYALPIIVSGGSAEEGATPEATIDKRFLIDLGVAEGKIILEDWSRDTYENAAFTRAVCERYGFKKPILLTSAFHLPRSVNLFRRAGLNVTPYPSNFYARGHTPYTYRSYLPSASGLWVTSSAVHEYLGLLFYRVVQ